MVGLPFTPLLLLWGLQPLTALVGGMIAFRGLGWGHDPVLIRAAKIVVAIPLLSVPFLLLLIQFDREDSADVLFSFPTLCSVIAMTSILVGERYSRRVEPPDDGPLSLK